MTTKHLAEFIHALAVRREEAKKWAAIHMRVPVQERHQLGAAELQQVFDFILCKNSTQFLCTDDGLDLFIITDNTRQNPHQVVEGVLREAAPSGFVRTAINHLSERGIASIQRELARVAAPNDRAARIGLTRLARTSNMFLVLDDDPMVLRQMEQVLKPLGHVETIDPHAHVVVMSADAVKDNILESKARGAKGFIAKPISKEQVMKQVMAAPTFVQRRG